MIDARGRNWLIVKITTDDGIGEATVDVDEMIFKVMHRLDAQNLDVSPAQKIV